ncbi:hypothetical protein [Mesorhizobium sp. M0276]|uniref:hypothetical protein n=1 Tax=Mesorhizobium sp. M0276 TaxID=2956928 RepID=UPI003338F59E
MPADVLCFGSDCLFWKGTSMKKSNFTGVSIIPSAFLPEAIAETSVQEQEPARARTPGSKIKKVAKASRPPATYEELGIPAEKIPVLVECENMFRGSERVDAEQVFVKGEAVAKARQACPSQESFATWLKGWCGQSRRTGDNFIAVHERLGQYRTLFVEHNVQRVALYALCAASPEKIEAVANRLRAGERPSAAEIGAFARDGATKAAPLQPANIAGPEGVKALIREKTAAGLPALIGRLCRMLEVVQEAVLRHAGGKPLVKKKLTELLVQPARRARAELESLAAFVEPNSNGPDWLVHTARFPADTGWSLVWHVLYTMAGADDWPKDDRFRPWFLEKVLPSLEWAVGPKLAAATAKAVKAKLETEAAMLSERKMVKASKTPRKMKGLAQEGRDAAEALSPMSAPKSPAASRKVVEAPMKTAALLNGEPAAPGGVAGEAAGTPEEAIAPKRAAKAAAKGTPAEAYGEREPIGPEECVRRIKATLLDVAVPAFAARQPREGFVKPPFLKDIREDKGGSPKMG